MTTPQANSALSSRRVAVIVMIVGLLMAVVAIFADDIGLSGGGDGYGWKQMIATIVGLAILV
ncbi:MAG TPA: hypothetical protein PK819_01240, partial [Thermomicrobiales bacterium]|nr:hypothetical protein [Thermomicrobiales bacterium]